MKSLFQTLIFISFCNLVIGQNSVSSTYSAGDIPTSYSSNFNMPELEDYDPSCTGTTTSLNVTLPSGDAYQVTGIDITYTMSPANGGLQLDQRSYIHFQNNGVSESSVATNFGQVPEPYTYTRNNVAIANGLYPGGTNLVFEMRAWRSWGQGSPECSTTYQKIDDGTWTITVHYGNETSGPPRVGIGTDEPDFSAMLDVVSTDKGVLIPRLTNLQMQGIESPKNGLLVYNTNENAFMYYSNFQWQRVSINELPIGGVNGNVLTTDGFGEVFWSEPYTSEVADADNDTKIQVEELVDEDVIRFDIEGQEVAVLDNGLTVEATGNLAKAVQGIAFPDGSTPHYGVYGEANGSYGIGVNGTSSGFAGNGVTGTSTNLTGVGIGGQFISEGSSGYGVWAEATGNSGTAIQAIANGSDAEAVLGSSINGYAGRFNGRTRVNGEFNIGSGANDYTFPLIRGTNGQILETDGNGQLSWVNNTGGSGSSNEIVDSDGDTKVTAIDEPVGTSDYINFQINNFNAAKFVVGNSFHNRLELSGNDLLIGQNAGTLLTSGNNNTVFGNNSSVALTSGHRNMGIGSTSLFQNQTGDDNIGIGFEALYNVTGSFNTAIGNGSLRSVDNESHNTAIGYESLYGNVSGYNNTAIGSGSGRNATGTGNVYIGNNAGANDTGSGRLFISNNNSSTPLIYGAFNDLEIGLNGDVAINKNTPDASAALDIASTTKGLLIPRMTSVQRTSISSPAEGLMVYETDVNTGFWYYDGSSWEKVGSLGDRIQNDANDTYVDVGGFPNRIRLSLDNEDMIDINHEGHFGFGQTNPSNKRIFGFAHSESAYPLEDMMELNWFSDIPLGKSILKLKTLETASENALFLDCQRGNLSNFRVYADGQTLIGTTPSAATDYLLSVDGKIASEEVLVQDSNDWPDYVFEENYNLKSIDQVEKFISSNGHLPDVPSAEEVKKDGISVAEMHKIQMRKIEELTLYVIELKKEIELLKSKNRMK